MLIRDPSARAMATVLLTGEWARHLMVERVLAAIGRPNRRRWAAALVDRVLVEFGGAPPGPRWLPLARFLASDDGLQRAHKWLPETIDTLWLPSPVMSPAPAIPGTSELPALVTPGALAGWLGLTPRELDWFADCQGRERRQPNEALRHYRYRWVPKSSGRLRLVESPKPRLKAIQRQILTQILDHLPPHPAAHAFRAGRSTVTCAAAHVGKRVVLRIDLRNFFPSIPRERVFALFRTIGYPEAVARLLAGICTNTVPDAVFDAMVSSDAQQLRRTFTSPHLPQGAPTSPALANLCAQRLDRRYADDLVFSGGRELDRCLTRFRVFIVAICLDEGFAIRRRKTRTQYNGHRQTVAGIIVNRHANIGRDEYDRLKAILWNCSQHGHLAQNRSGHAGFRQHLAGRVAYVRMVNPTRGAKLRALFERIDWSEMS